MFRALLLEPRDGLMENRIESIDESRLMPGDVEINVEYSSLNYKDALAVTGSAKVIRGEFPFVPGIDLAGTVTRSDSPLFHEGDRVLQNGWGLGESHWGGLAERARVRSEWLIAVPESLSTLEAMTIGTAGYTAALALMAIGEFESSSLARTEGGEYAVTGASGGVGSFAIALLAASGRQAVAISGKSDATDYLTSLGASRVAPRDEITGGEARPMERARWSGAIDNVGGTMLARLLAQMKPRTAVASCGNAGGFDLPASVLPFILRGVALLGIDSNTCPNELRREAWNRLASLPKETIDSVRSEVISLDEVPDRCSRLVRGEVRGRIVVAL